VSADEVTTGVRSVLSLPYAYELFARLIGGRRARARFVSDHLRAEPQARVLDVGCGTGSLLEYLPDVRYVGLDLSPEYVEYARARFAGRGGEFRVAEASSIPADLGTFDLAFAIGVLHHMSDDQVRRMVEGVASALGPGGRFVTLDNAYVQGQHWVARALARCDRGQHVRAPQGYVDLVEAAFDHVDVTIIHDMLRVPYTTCVIECTGPKDGKSPTNLPSLDRPVSLDLPVR
jgi:SAM-dependent methyltransferase